MLPDGSGVHIALQCQKELMVVRLFHLRGEKGEFSGGNQSVICKYIDEIHILSDSYLMFHIFNI